MRTQKRAWFVEMAVLHSASSVAAHVRRALILLVLCSLLLITALPLVAGAQENGSATETEEATPQSPATLLNLYPSEGVPGGGGSIGDFVVGPGKVDITIEPGQSKLTEMTVTNRTGETRRFKITIEDTAGSSNVDTPVVLLGDDRGPYSLRDYIYIPHLEFDLAHNQRARIPVTVTLPADAEPGGFYGSVLVQTVAIEGRQGDTAGTVPQSPIIARVGTLFFVTVPGEIERNAELKDFGTIPEQRFYQDGPIHFGLLYENTGSIHVAPYGELRIHNMFGEEVGYLELEPWFVLPSSLRLREIAWNRDLLFGRYTATVAINRSYDDVIDNMSYSFWVLPWKPLVLSFVVLFIVIFAIRSFFKRFEFRRKS